MININLTQTYTFTIGSLTGATVTQKFRLYVDNVLLIDSWTAPAATNAILTGIINLEKPADSTSFYYPIQLEYSKSLTGCHSFSLQWNLAAPSGPSVSPEYYALQIPCRASATSIFRPYVLPTCMSKSTILLSSNSIVANSEILMDISPKDAFEAQRFVYDWIQFEFFVAKLQAFHKNPMQLQLSSKMGSNVLLSTIVSQSGQYQVVLGSPSQYFAVATVFSDIQCSKIVSEISFPSLPALSATRINIFAQYNYSCVLWRISFRSKYAGMHAVLLSNLSHNSSVKLSSKDHMIAWNGSSVFSLKLDLKSHEMMSLVITQLSDSIENLHLQILEGRYFTNDPWSAKEQPDAASSFGCLNDAFIASFNILVVSGATCHSRTKLRGHGLSIATEGSSCAFSIELKDAFDNSVEFLMSALQYTASIRDVEHFYKASSQNFETNSCADGHLGCVRYKPIGSGLFEMKFATGLQETGLVATYFSDLGQSIALACTFGLTEIATNGNPFVSNSEFAIRWAGFIQKPSPTTVTFSFTVLTEFESVSVWIDNILLLVQESVGQITATMTFEDTLANYEIEVFYTKRGLNPTFGFSMIANQAMSYSNSFKNVPSISVTVFPYQPQFLSFFPTAAKASSSTVVTIFGRQLSNTCSYVCNWAVDSSQIGLLTSEWQVLVGPNILLCATPSAATLQGLSRIQVIESCGVLVRLLKPSEGLKNSNHFIFQKQITHSSLQRISRSQRVQISTELLLSGAESFGDVTACIMYGRSSSSAIEDYSGPLAVNSGIMSQKLDYTISCAGFGQGEWNGVGQISISVEHSLSSVIGSASALISGNTIRMLQELLSIFLF